MARRRYGSKAAYEAARGLVREANQAIWDRWEKEQHMTEDERTKARNAERLRGDEAMMTFMLLMAAAMAGGRDPKTAALHADQAVAEIERRFVR